MVSRVSNVRCSREARMVPFLPFPRTRFGWLSPTQVRQHRHRGVEMVDFVLADCLSGIQ